MTRTPVLIIGAGPIGLELAAALKAAGIDYAHVDAGQIGHTISWYAPHTRFFSSPERLAIAGVPLVTADQAKPSREEYLAYLRAVVEQFDLRVHTFEQVTGIRPGPEGFLVHTQARAGPREYLAQSVVLAIGDMHRPRLLNIPGEDLAHVSHYFQEPHTCFRQRVLIVGGKNSAVEAAMRCWRAGAHVSISYRGEKFDPERIKYWLLPEINWLIDKKRIAFHPRTIPTRITPANVTLAAAGGGAPLDVPADFVLILTGYEQDPALFQLAGVRLEGDNLAPVHNPATMETNVPGLYVAGTASAGTQRRFRAFIETSHVHVDRIVRALTGAPALAINAEAPAAAPEM